MSRLTGFRRADHHCLRRAAFVIFLAILSLTLSLATRTSVPSASGSVVAAQSATPQAVRQHLDSDAAQWVPPVAPAALLEVISFYPRFSPAGPPIASLFFENSLYNRPPPSC